MATSCHLGSAGRRRLAGRAKIQADVGEVHRGRRGAGLVGSRGLVAAQVEIQIEVEAAARLGRGRGRRFLLRFPGIEVEIQPAGGAVRLGLVHDERAFRREITRGRVAGRPGARAEVEVDGR